MVLYNGNNLKYKHERFPHAVKLHKFQQFSKGKILSKIVFNGGYNRLYEFQKYYQVFMDLYCTASVDHSVNQFFHNFRVPAKGNSLHRYFKSLVLHAVSIEYNTCTDEQTLTVALEYADEIP